MTQSPEEPRCISAVQSFRLTDAAAATGLPASKAWPEVGPATSAAASRPAPSRQARGVRERVRAMVGLLLSLLVHQWVVVCARLLHRWRHLVCPVRRVARPV